MTSKPSDASRWIDWAEVRARLDRAWASRDGLTLTSEQADAILTERARALARVPPSALNAGPGVEVATFALGDERYAIETCYVQRVARVDDCTPIPGAPEILLGVINAGGEVLAIFDIRPLFGGTVGSAMGRGQVLIVGNDREELGILVDEAHEFLILRLEDVLAPPPSLGGEGRHLVRGVTSDALIVIDGAALLRDERLFINQGDDTSV
jgi:purine-binding chemotaxis protein CheW